MKELAIESDKSIILDEDVNITVKNNSKVNIFSFNKNVEIIINLEGESSEVNCYNLFYGINNDEIKIKINAIHNNINTKANLVCKGILDDNSKLNYSGKIRMEKGAKNSEGYQKQDTLLLSKKAFANSLPELEINENEVKCSHGVTIAEIEEDQLFYLQSRGLTRKEAENQVIRGFLEPVIIKIKDDILKEEIRKLIGDRL